MREERVEAELQARLQLLPPPRCCCSTDRLFCTSPGPDRLSLLPPVPMSSIADGGSREVDLEQCCCC